MAEITVKQLVTLEKRFKEAARTFGSASEKADKARGSSKSLRVAEANEAFEKLQKATLRYVCALVTGFDGKLPTSSSMFGITAMVIRGSERKPYDRVFKLAEARAAKGG